MSLDKVWMDCFEASSSTFIRDRHGLYMECYQTALLASTEWYYCPSLLGKGSEFRVAYGDRNMSILNYVEGAA